MATATKAQKNVTAGKGGRKGRKAPPPVAKHSRPAAAMLAALRRDKAEGHKLNKLKGALPPAAKRDEAPTLTACRPMTGAWLIERFILAKGRNKPFTVAEVRAALPAVKNVPNHLGTLYNGTPDGRYKRTIIRGDDGAYTLPAASKNGKAK